ncbi:hypothetical protein APB26_32525 [Pseudomonas aeruginosa]|uniref:hypothetical protein n=1 Tax=Pseudomonas aeruginosa TaxID=287 RepID=UPI00071BF5A0|nr:hypothetical protein [Pseudomonas aeruginosa]KSQ21708.1 hypothetical protein APB26_32525 [Pseudomonas aeruginosa]RPV61380.1 hypothetical protein IPC838_18860 [Pseudomonas aeruginosa]
MQESNKPTDDALVDKALRRLVNTDVAIGLISVAPFASLLWQVHSDPRFAWKYIAMTGALFLWTMLFVGAFVLRKVRNKLLWASAAVFSAGVFCSCLTLAFVTLPPSWAVGAVPIATYWIVKLRAKGYHQVELMQRATSKSTGQMLG